MANDHLYQEHDREARIRECAYHLWESHGKPYGRDVEFWQRARQLIAREDEPASAPPEPAAAEPAEATATSRRRKAPAGRRQSKAS